MKWAESMHEIVTVVPIDEITRDESKYFTPQPASWTPHDVWLTRVKQPRDRAAAAVASGN